MTAPPQRALIGKILLASALTFLVAALLVWTGVVPLGGTTRGLVAGVLLFVAIVDGVLGLRFVGES